MTNTDSNGSKYDGIALFAFNLFPTAVESSTDYENTENVSESFEPFEGDDVYSFQSNIDSKLAEEKQMLEVLSKIKFYTKITNKLSRYNNN